MIFYILTKKKEKEKQAKNRYMRSYCAFSVLVSSALFRKRGRRPRIVFHLLAKHYVYLPAWRVFKKLGTWENFGRELP